MRYSLACFSMAYIQPCLLYILPYILVCGALGFPPTEFALQPCVCCNVSKICVTALFVLHFALYPFVWCSWFSFPPTECVTMFLNICVTALFVLYFAAQPCLFYILPHSLVCVTMLLNICVTVLFDLRRCST